MLNLRSQLMVFHHQLEEIEETILVEETDHYYEVEDSDPYVVLPNTADEIKCAIHDGFTLDVVLLKTIFGELLKLRSRATVVGVREDADATAGGEEARYLDVLGVHQADEVFHDDVYAVFMEVAVVTEGEEIEFEALAFYHLHIGDVGDADFCKVGLSRDGAKGGELGAVETHPVVVFLVLVDEALEHFGSVVCGVLCALASEMLEAFSFALRHICRD